MVKKSEYFLIRMFWIGRDPPPFWPKVKKQFFMPPLIVENVYLFSRWLGVLLRWLALGWPSLSSGWLFRFVGLSSDYLLVCLGLFIDWSLSVKGRFSSFASFRPEDGPEGKYSQRSYSQSSEIYVVSLVGSCLSNHLKLKVLWRPVPNWCWHHWRCRGSWNLPHSEGAISTKVCLQC